MGSDLQLYTIKVIFLFKNPSLGRVGLKEPMPLFVFIINVLILKSKAGIYRHAEGKKVAKGLVVFKEYTKYLKLHLSTADVEGSSRKYREQLEQLCPAPFLSPTLRPSQLLCYYPFCGTILGLHLF